MSTKPYTAWYNEVLPHLPGCPEPLALNAIRNAVIEFMERSWVFSDFLDAVSVNATIADIEFETPDDLLVSKLLTAWYDDAKLVIKTPDEMEEIFGQNWSTKTGTPTHATQLNERELRLVPIPAADLQNALLMRVTFKPTRDSTAVDERIFEEYLEPIACGALAKLFILPQKPWTNPEASKWHSDKFNEGIDKARQKALKGFGRARRRVKAHFA